MISVGITKENKMYTLVYSKDNKILNCVKSTTLNGILSRNKHIVYLDSEDKELIMKLRNKLFTLNKNLFIVNRTIIINVFLNYKFLKEKIDIKNKYYDTCLLSIMDYYFNYNIKSNLPL
jgi:hypothetical protein